NYCQRCYKDLTTVTPGTVQLIQNLVMQNIAAQKLSAQNLTAQNLTTQNLTTQNLTTQNLSFAFWIGLRENFSGSVFWSQWSNGAPVIYQNWYPGRPILKKMDLPVPTSPPTTTSTAGTSATTTATTTAGTTATTTTTGTTTTTDRFFGAVSVSNFTHNESILSWSPAPGDIDHYRIEQITVSTSNITVMNESGLNITLRDLVPGTQYHVKVIPVKCGRDLNPQNISFSTLPMEISNVSQVRVGTNDVVLSWSVPNGGRDNYSVNTMKGENQASCYENGSLVKEENYTVSGLYPGQLYSFAVCAVVNKTKFGAPGRISVYTKPSRLKKLTSLNNDSSEIYASWNSNDTNAADYTYNVNLTYHNETLFYSTTSSNSITVPGLTPGTKYYLTVSALVNNSLEGEALTISAYTRQIIRSVPFQLGPQKVDSLTLTPSHNSITVNWTLQNGSFSRFSVHLTLNSSQIPETVNVTSLSHTFTGLKSTSLYIVSVITHVEIDEYPSEKVTESCYTSSTAAVPDSDAGREDAPYGASVEVGEDVRGQTKLPEPSQEEEALTGRPHCFVGVERPGEVIAPVPPANVSAVVINNSAVDLTWEAPNTSDWAQSILYNVKCYSSFWNDMYTWNLTVTNSPSANKTIPNLKSGTKYNFEVSVFAGTLMSAPITAECTTNTKWRNVTLTMLCSSATSLYCKKALPDFKNELTSKMKSKFAHNITWNVTFKDGKLL
ncbi:hypothetical protein NFI96_016027, partial [Prochilodus magdalenae]